MARTLYRPLGQFRVPRFRLAAGQRLSGRRLSGRRSGGRWLRAAVAVVLAAAVFLFLDARAKPQIRALAETAARQQATAAVTQAIEDVLIEEGVTYESLVAIAVDADGVRSIQTDTYHINLLKGKINAAAETAVALRDAKLRLPLGALLGSDLFAGWGPKIGVPLTMTGHALSTISSDLSSAGLNQTLHRIMMQMHVSLSVILSGEIVTVELETAVCLAETVIVGSVPNGVVAGIRS
ncbi:MAG: sporulation protein YunB [Oscillospiraceae bacterium]|jgi:sporulation protein YunB|nr:sporulation protein YunB [Oscillospiraceae bacterium]